MRFRDIPKFPHSVYAVDMSWTYLERSLKNWEPLDMDPIYQRGHVWTMEQRVAYIEYCLRGGDVSNTIIFNNPDPDRMGTTSIIDGKQRLTTVLMFMHDEVRAFGLLYSEFEGGLGPLEPALRFKLVELHTEEEILDLYLSINVGGTPHSAEEIERVRDLKAHVMASDILRRHQEGENFGEH